MKELVRKMMVIIVKVSVKNRLMLFGKWFGCSGSGFCLVWFDLV